MLEWNTLPPKKDVLALSFAYKMINYLSAKLVLITFNMDFINIC
jgi:hypothetical protein